jgi:hypothetical protein
MPRPAQVVFLLLILAITRGGAYTPAPQAPRPFRFPADAFSFANETVWNYVDGSVHPDTAGEAPRTYTRHCFTITRAAVQFWKFARFDVTRPRLSDAELAQRIRAVTERSAWLPALTPQERIVIPGYGDLRAASAAHPGIFQANIGLGWPIYFRPGNMPIAIPVTRSLEARLNDEIVRDLRRQTPTILWLYNFPSLKINHVVVVYSGTRHGDVVDYHVYDPNYADAPKKLRFDASTKSFSYQPTFFFKGGEVTARAIYRGLLQ